MTPKCVTFLRCFNHTQFELTDGGRRKSDFSIIAAVLSFFANDVHTFSTPLLKLKPSGPQRHYR